MRISFIAFHKDEDSKNFFKKVFNVTMPEAVNEINEMEIDEICLLSADMKSVEDIDAVIEFLQTTKQYFK